MAQGTHIGGWRRALLVFGVLAVLASGAWAGGEVGTPAPDFTLVDLDGTTWTLSDLSGQVVFLSMVGFS